MQIIIKKSQHPKLMKNRRRYVYFCRENKRLLFRTIIYCYTLLVRMFAYAWNFSMYTPEMSHHLYRKTISHDLMHRFLFFRFIHWSNCAFVNRCDAALEREFPITSAASTLLMVHDNEFHFWYRRNNRRWITITIGELIASLTKIEVTPGHNINVIECSLCAFDASNNNEIVMPAICHVNFNLYVN